MSEPQDRETGPVAKQDGPQNQPNHTSSSDSSDTPTARPRVPDTIGVYDRPTGLKRYPAWLVVLFGIIILASIAYFLFTFVF